MSMVHFGVHFTSVDARNCITSCGVCVCFSCACVSVCAHVVLASCVWCVRSACMDYLRSIPPVTVVSILLAEFEWNKAHSLWSIFLTTNQRKRPNKTENNETEKFQLSVLLGRFCWFVISSFHSGCTQASPRRKYVRILSFPRKISQENKHFYIQNIYIQKNQHHTSFLH